MYVIMAEEFFFVVAEMKFGMGQRMVKDYP